jgi:DNA-binding response OmpR family regulator
MMRILVAEDETKINEMICDYLDALGYETVSALDGRDALKQFRKVLPDLILMDIMMPVLDGTDVLREIRKESRVPVIMVTAKAGEGDTVLGLELGADDYITKPFSMKELAARIRAVLRRIEPEMPAMSEDSSTDSSVPVSMGDLTLDPAKRTVRVKGHSVEMTAAQFSILYKMICSPGRVYSRMDLLKSFQEDPYEGYERSIDVHIKNIRKLIEEDPSHPEYIQTVWGVGYRMREDA